MSSSFRMMDGEGDVDMTPAYISPPETITAPRLQSWNQMSLIRWKKERIQYEQRLRERCTSTGEQYDSIAVSIKGSVDVHLLANLAAYVLRKALKDLTDTDITNEITRRCTTVKNNHLPDLETLFAEKLRMDLKEDDVEARVLKYFTSFNSIVEEHGLHAVLGPSGIGDTDAHMKTKSRTKILINNLAPQMLKREIERLVALEHRRAKTDEVALYELVLERACAQHHYFLLTQEDKSKSQKTTPVKDRRTPAASQATRPPKVERPNGRSQGSQQPASTSAVPPREGCLVCKGPHWMRECPTATPDQKREAREEMRARSASKTSARRATASVSPGPQLTALIGGDVEVPLCADSGSDLTIIPRNLLQALPNLARTTSPLRRPVKVEVVGGATFECRERIALDVQIRTAAGPVNIRGVTCLILDEDETQFILGKDVLNSLGIDVGAMIEKLAGQDTPDYDADDLSSIPGIEVGLDAEDEVSSLLSAMEAAALQAEQDDVGLARELYTLAKQHRDIWRNKLGYDPPAKVEPLLVKFKTDAKPVTSKARPYPQQQSDYLRSYMAELVKLGLVRRNNHSHWSSPALPVRKGLSPTEFRTTVDFTRVNNLTIPIAGIMPDMKTVIVRVRGAKYFARFDNFKGFWQMGLHPDCQEQFSIVTEDGVFTPTRVPQGATNSAIHYQNQMHTVYAPMLYDNLLVWVDDIVVFARTRSEFVAKVAQFFELTAQYGLKLSVTKSLLLCREVLWCGKFLSEHGVRHDPARVAALTALPAPDNAADLQRLLCAGNWLRESVIDFSRIAAPLYAKLDAAFAARGRTKRIAAGITLSWTPEELEAYKGFLGALRTSTRLAFPLEEATVCVFTDASDCGWALIVTQVGSYEDQVPVEQQAHELLACMGGVFRGAQCNWSVTEKEGYPIVKACIQLEFLLTRQRGFRLFCDHANLIHIFSPHQSVKKHIRGKLQRWALQLVPYRYEIEHLSGERNIFADIVSRWLSLDSKTSSSARAARLRSHTQLSALRPLQSPDFVFPSMTEIAAHQRRASSRPGPMPTDGSPLRVDGKVWLPPDADQLILRVFIVAHCGVRGHRGIQVMMNVLQNEFQLDDMKRRVQAFVKTCLLCHHVKGNRIIQRDWTTSGTATKRNETLLLDYLYLGESLSGAKYCLVLKDAFTHFCELVTSDTASARVAADAIIDWYKRFGLPEALMTDNGTHFRNQVIAQVTEQLGMTHRLSPVYAPWLNGAAERVNRDVLQVARVMLLEAKLDVRNWDIMLPVIQACINHAPVASLGNKCPMEVFTGLEPPPVLTSITIPSTPTGEHVVSPAAASEHLDKLKRKLEHMHLVVTKNSNKRQDANRARSTATAANFEEGDFVLWSRVDPRLSAAKLTVRWVGPFVVRTIKEHCFEIENLLTQSRHDVHGSRLKLYSETSLELTEELREHIAMQGLILGVREICDLRFNEAATAWEVQVAWIGLEDAETSWEPFSSINADVPALVETYLSSNESSPAVTRLRRELQ